MNVRVMGGRVLPADLRFLRTIIRTDPIWGAQGQTRVLPLSFKECSLLESCTRTRQF